MYLAPILNPVAFEYLFYLRLIFRLWAMLILAKLGLGVPRWAYVDGQRLGVGGAISQ